MGEQMLLLLGVLVALLVGFAAGALIVRALSRPVSTTLPDPVLQALAEVRTLGSRLGEQNAALSQIQQRLAAEAQGQQTMQATLSEARQTLGRLQTDYEARLDAEQRGQERLRRLEAVLLGSASRGRAGEAVLQEALGNFPPEMLQTGVAVGRGVVEFALVLSDGKLLPIDSKWPAADLLTQLEETTDPAERLRLASAMERELLKRVKEVAGYIDSERTLPWAVAAVPDAAFHLVPAAQQKAFGQRVILLSYSLTLPYLLTIYALHLQYARTVDTARLHDHLSAVARVLDAMQETQANQLERGLTMAGNAADKYREYLADLRGSLNRIEALSAPQPPGAARPEGDLPAE